MYTELNIFDEIRKGLPDWNILLNRNFKKVEDLIEGSDGNIDDLKKELEKIKQEINIEINNKLDVIEKEIENVSESNRGKVLIIDQDYEGEREEGAIYFTKQK